MDEAYKKLKTGDNASEGLDTESNHPIKFIVTPVSFSSEDTIEITEVEAGSSGLVLDSDPMPSSSKASEGNANPMSREELIKSFVVELPSSDSSDSDTEGRIRPGSIEGCRGYLNVCMNRTSNDEDISTALRHRPNNQSRHHKYEKAGFRGLINIGNTCFMNSILQCLSNTAPLLRYILSDKFIPEVNSTGSPLKGGLLSAFARLVKELWRLDTGSPVDTTGLKNQLQVFAPRFRGFSQHDSQELLRYLLDGLHHDLNRVKSKPPYVTFETDPSWNLATHSLNAWKSYIRVDSSQIVDIFVGQLKSTLCCSVCGHISVTFDPFWDLSLSIPQPKSGSVYVTLEKCLESFTKEETLDGDEKAYCSKCKTHQKATKRFTIERFPEVLVIHLKRFTDEEKLRTAVRFPLIGLDIGPYSSSNTSCCSYNLYGISNHCGNVFAGHYIAYCKHPYTNNWSTYDDCNVQPCTSQVVKECEAYVLFYEMSEGSKSVLF